MATLMFLFENEKLLDFRDRKLNGAILWNFQQSVDEFHRYATVIIRGFGVMFIGHGF